MGKYITKEKQTTMQLQWYINHRTIAKWIISTNQSQLEKAIIKRWLPITRISAWKSTITNKYCLKLKPRDSTYREVKIS